MTPAPDDELEFPTERFRGLSWLGAAAVAAMIAGCAHAVEEPNEPLVERPETDLFVPGPDADADVPDPTRNPARYEPLASLDESGDGAIDEHELGIASTRAFSSFDANGDARLEEGELRDGATRQGTPAAELDAAVGIMAGWDTDGDGYLQAAEFRAGRFLLLDGDQDDAVDEQEWNSQSWQHRYGLPLDMEEHPGY